MPTKKDGQWYVDIRPWGEHGLRKRKSFTNKAEAVRYKAYWLNQGTLDPWNPEKKDTRKFSELIQIWFDNFGKHLSDGEGRKRALTVICSVFGDPVASTITPQHFINYRNTKTGRAKKPISPKTLNNHLVYCNVVFNKLKKSRVITFDNPLNGVDQIKYQQKELSWLTTEQIEELFKAIKEHCPDPHVYLIAKICINTGCRWGEAQNLKTGQVKNNAITFINTKSKKTRTVPITEALVIEIETHSKTYSPLFSRTHKHFDRIVKNFVSFTLPDGQASHILRHSYASHFMMNGGNLYTLKQILGHSTIAMTERYAHLSPDHLSQASELRPMANI